MAFAELHPGIEEVLVRRMPSEHSVRLDALPEDILRDAETLNSRAGSLLAFAFLFHTTDASFGDVKAFLAARGWTAGIED
jgi:hypothetical protein